MYTRIASFEGGDTARLNEMNLQRAESGTMNMPDGLRRAMALVDEPGGKRLFVSFFDTLEDVQASEERFESMGDEIPEDIRGRRTAVEVYEVVWDSGVLA